MQISEGRRLFILALTACALACGGGPTAPTLPPYDGIWVGETAEGGRVELTVVNNAVTRFEMEVRLGEAGSTRCGVFVFNDLGRGISPPATIVANSFSFDLGGLGSAGKTTISGRFDSVQRLSGSYSPFSISLSSSRPECQVTVKPAGTFFAEQ